MNGFNNFINAHQDIIAVIVVILIMLYLYSLNLCFVEAKPFKVLISIFYGPIGLC